jgi:hypothetical protein
MRRFASSKASMALLAASLCTPSQLGIVCGQQLGRHGAWRSSSAQARWRRHVNVQGLALSVQSHAIDTSQHRGLKG